MRRSFLLYALLVISLLDPVYAADGSQSDRYSPVSVVIRFYQNYISDLHYGHCRFKPSCSHYALDAFNRYGVIRGSALTADRLVRCNRGAGRFYPEDTEGRLLDPVTGTGTRRLLLVPPWLLPPAEGPLTLSQHSKPADSTLDSYDNSQSPLETVSLDRHIAFASYLARDGDCERAITEYKYIAFAAGTDDALRWSRMKSGECYYRLERWGDAAEAYLEAARISGSDSKRDAALFMAAACRFNQQRFDESVMILDRCSLNGSRSSSSPVPKADVHGGNTGERHNLSPAVSDRSLLFDREVFLSGLASMARGEWEAGELQMNTLAARGGESPFAGGAAFLAGRARNADALPKKSSTVAMVLSAVIPGSGQFYSGRFNDGLRHMIFNGLLGYGVYKLIDDENYTSAYLLAGVTLPFYAGNIAGAKRSAEYYTNSKRIAAISRWLSGAESAISDMSSYNK